MRGRRAGRRTAAAGRLTGPAPTGLVLIAAKCARAGAEQEWARWYATYLTDLVGGGVVATSLWTLDGAPAPGGPGPGHSHLARIDLVGSVPDTLTALDARAREARAGATIHPAHAEIRRDVWTRHGRQMGRPPEANAADAMITAEVLCTDPRREPEWNTWYDDQHLPDMMASDAFTSGSRWRRHPLRAGGANHLTVYEITGLTVTQAVERSAAAMPALVAAGRKHECHAGGLTMALTRVAAE